MNSGSFYYLLVILAVTVAMMGCSSVKNVTERSQLVSAGKTGPITVFTKDQVTYKLTSYALVESTLSGSGTKNNGNGWLDFKREDIPLSEIKYIHARQFDFLKTIVTIGGIAAIGAMVISNLENDNNTTVTEDVKFHNPYGGGGGGGGSSCPYIYSWTGSSYSLDAEAFGIAFGRSLEIKTSHVLSSLAPSGDILKIKIANERPETHYLNQVQLFGVEAPENSTVFLDESDQAWPVYSASPPLEAVDDLGNDITGKVKTHDGFYWESGPPDRSSGMNFEDVVDLKFINGHKDGSLLITGINSEFSQVVFKNVFDFLGDNSLSFMDAVENDPEMIKALRYWIDESSLKISVWNGNEFMQAGKLHAEATAVPFSRIVRIDTKSIADDTVKIRLSCLKDVWRIDRVQVDWTPASSLHGKQLDLVSALRENNIDVSPNISGGDEKYEVLLPPEYIELRYRSEKAAMGNKTSYILSARGYLYEWLPQGSNGNNDMLASAIPSEMKVGYLKNLIRQKGIFLPPIYAEWYKMQTTAK